MPAEQIALFGKFKRPDGTKLDAGALLRFVAEPISPLVFKDVLQTRVFAICAIAPIAMNRQRRLRESFDILRLNKTDHVRDARECFLVAMAHAKAAACA